MFPVATGIYYLIQSMQQAQEKGGGSLTHEGTEARNSKSSISDFRTQSLLAPCTQLFE